MPEIYPWEAALRSGNYRRAAELLRDMQDLEDVFWEVTLKRDERIHCAIEAGTMSASVLREEEMEKARVLLAARRKEEAKHLPRAEDYGCQGMRAGALRSPRGRKNP